MPCQLGFISLGNIGEPIARTFLGDRHGLRVGNVGVGEQAVAEMIGWFSPLHHSSYAKGRAEGQFEPAGFRLSHGLKDMDLIPGAAAKSLTPLPLARLLLDRWLSSLARGRGNLDGSAITRDVAEQAGIDTMSAPS